ncbi:MAG: hypothetical protein CFH03_01179 [Alphaproteobacteria bacterium MarineAlpha3_Bin2]|jgi:hypothetical protein|nr:MAG: hypothetical protein CFH03_01179 [Alphaproteobacteria bacterium MarineAlpha3_Bin2]
MAQSPVATKVHQPFDVHCNFAAKIAFDLEILIDGFTDPAKFVIGQVIHPTLGRDSNVRANFSRGGMTDTVDISKCNNDSLTSRNINASNTRQGSFSLKLGKKQYFVPVGCPEEARL